MIEFSILKKSKKSKARLGILKTPHGEVETPACVGVATNATIKPADDVRGLFIDPERCPNAAESMRIPGPAGSR